MDYVQRPVRQLDPHHFERSAGLIVTKEDDSVIAACGIRDDQLRTCVTNDVKGACFLPTRWRRADEANSTLTQLLWHTE